MIKSMTGFGKGESSGKLGKFAVEIRTVNHRYFDVSSRLPNSLNEFEDRIRKYLNNYIKRGKVNFSLSHRNSESNLNAVKVDNETVNKYFQMLVKIRKKFKLKDDIKLEHILSFPGLIAEEQIEYDAETVWPLLEKAVKEAVIGCNKMREKEGEALCKDLTERIIVISKSLDEISKLEPQFMEEYKAKMDAKIKEILKGNECNIDRARLETELAIFAKQCDVSEEMTRARCHLDALKNALASKTEIGRRLDFILQELQREINTLGSKTGSVNISRLVVDIKSEIEKIREQIQNIE